MNRRLLALGCVALLLIGAVLASGCARERRGDGTAQRSPALQTTPAPVPPAGTPGTPVAGSCVAKGGSVCSAGTDCPGTWIDATDTFSCCSKPCTGAGGSALVTIEPYETEVANSDLGDIL